MAHRLSTYLDLLDDLRAAGFRCHPVRDYFIAATGEARPPDGSRRQGAAPAYLRHDVDRMPGRAVAMAEAEAERGIAASYYFRCDARMRFPRQEMRCIAALGHETGFHYESLSRTGGDHNAALSLFQRELAACRAIVPVTTVAPHGAPLAISSNMAFAASIDAGGSDLLGDATDMDFTNMLYVTDTGGSFGSRANLRDRVDGPSLPGPVGPGRLVDWIVAAGHRAIVLSTHPERWPRRLPGLVQASARDVATNAAKMLIASLRPARQ